MLRHGLPCLSEACDYIGRPRRLNARQRLWRLILQSLVDHSCRHPAGTSSSLIYRSRSRRSRGGCQLCSSSGTTSSLIDRSRSRRCRGRMLGCSTAIASTIDDAHLRRMSTGWRPSSVSMNGRGSGRYVRGGQGGCSTRMLLLLLQLLLLLKSMMRSLLS